MINPKTQLKHACYHCEKSFVNSFNLKKHVENKHGASFVNVQISQGVKTQSTRGGDKDKFACFCCWDSFEKLEDLRKHVEITHLIAEETDTVQEQVQLPTLKAPVLLPELKESSSTDSNSKHMSLVEAASNCLDIHGELVQKVSSLIKLTDLKPFIFRDVSNQDSNQMIAYTSSRNLKRHMDDETSSEKRYKMNLLRETSSSTTCELITNITKSSLLNEFVASSPYKRILAFDHFDEITSQQAKALNSSWRGNPRMCQAIGNLLCGVVLIDGNQALLVNSVEIYSRYHTMDAHYEHFVGDSAKNSMPLPNSKYENLRVAWVDKKLLIGSAKMNALVVSSIRIDTDKYEPEVGPYTSHFIPSENTRIFLSAKSMKKADEILSTKSNTLECDQDILTHLKQVQSKFHKPSTYNASRFHYMHNSDLTTQPYTIFTLADHDTIKDSDPIFGSQIFQMVALAVYNEQKLARSGIELLLKNRSKETTAVKAARRILDMFNEVDEIDIIENTKLDSVLKEISDVIVVNGLRAANRDTSKIIWDKFNTYRK